MFVFVLKHVYSLKECFNFKLLSDGVHLSAMELNFIVLLEFLHNDFKASLVSNNGREISRISSWNSDDFNKVKHLLNHLLSLKSHIILHSKEMLLFSQLLQYLYKQRWSTYDIFNCSEKQQRVVFSNLCQLSLRRMHSFPLVKSAWLDVFESIPCWDFKNSAQSLSLLFKNEELKEYENMMIEKGIHVRQRVDI